MTFAEKLKLLRGQKGWKQADLAESISIHREQVSTYERGQTIPNSEILMQLAKVLNVSVDYLIFDDEGKNLMNGKLNDWELLKQFEKLDKMNDKDRTLVKEVIELAIIKNQVHNLVA